MHTRRQPVHSSGQQPLCSVLAIIPARGGSKGVPRKNARLLAGRPLVHYACNCATESRFVTRTILSTDCPEIAELGRAAGAEVPFLRPPDLATDESPTIDVVDHVLDWLRSSEGWHPDIVVLLQPTAPLRRATDVDAALDRLLDSRADAVVSVTRVPSHFHPQWQFDIVDEQLRLVTGAPLEEIVPSRQLLTPTFVRNGAIYAFFHDAFRRTRSLYGTSATAYEMPQEASINIDSLADWHAAEAALSRAAVTPAVA